MNVANFDQHYCKKIRSYLDSYMNDELLAETNYDVLRHLESCADCAQALASRRRVKSLLQRAVARDRAPEGLRARIQKEIRRSDPARLSHQRFQWAIAAAAAIVLMAGAWGVIGFLNSGGARSPLEQSAEILKIGLKDHVVCAIEHHNGDKRFTPEQMAEAMGDDYIGLVPLVRERVPAGYEIVVAHKCRVSKRQFLHLVLRNQEKVLSLAITKKDGEAFPQSAMAAMTESTGLRLYESRLDNYEVTGFETKDYFGFVVSSLDKEDNLRIASNIAPAVRDFLAKLEA